MKTMETKKASIEADDSGLEQLATAEGRTLASIWTPDNERGGSGGDPGAGGDHGSPPHEPGWTWGGEVPGRTGGGYWKPYQPSVGEGLVANSDHGQPATEIVLLAQANTSADIFAI